jgi:hypothetical protein
VNILVGISETISQFCPLAGSRSLQYIARFIEGVYHYLVLLFNAAFDNGYRRRYRLYQSFGFALLGRVGRRKKYQAYYRKKKAPLKSTLHQ